MVEEDGDDEVDLADEDDDFACGCCVKGVGFIDSDGRNVDPFDVPYTDDDNLDLRDDFADDEEEGFADEDEDDPADDEKDDPVFYLLRKLVRGINAILKELEL